MKTIKKSFYGAFGNTYEREILSKYEVCDLIDAIDQDELLREMLGKHVDGNHTEAFLDITSGEIEIYSFIGNTQLQQEGHLISLNSISGIAEEGLHADDFLDDEEFEKAGDDPWAVIRKLDDYQDRLEEAYIHYHFGFDEISIDIQLEEIYEL